MSESCRSIEILLAGEEDETTLSLGQTLSGWGYKVTTAKSLTEAEAVFFKIQPKVVLAHWRFNKGKGMELYRRLRRAENISGCFLVILFSESEIPGLSDEAISLVDDFLCQPWDGIRLRTRLRSWERVIRLEDDLGHGMRALENANRKVIQANEKMRKDLYLVAKIQTALLPTVLPAVDTVVFAWVYKPRLELAGDGLNVFRLDENHVGFYILDVSGSGTSSALLSVSLSRVISPFPAQSSLLKELTAKPPGYRIRQPEEVLSDLNRSFPQDPDTKEYFTILYGILDLKTNVFSYSTAGHPLPLVLTSKGRFKTISGGGTPIGLVDDAIFAREKCKLSHGDRMYLFSDGLVDAFSPERVSFGISRLSKAIQASSDLALKGSVDRILSTGETWCGAAGWHDDVSLLALEVR